MQIDVNRRLVTSQINRVCIRQPLTYSYQMIGRLEQASRSSFAVPICSGQIPKTGKQEYLRKYFSRSGFVRYFLIQEHWQHKLLYTSQLIRTQMRLVYMWIIMHRLRSLACLKEFGPMLQIFGDISLDISFRRLRIPRDYVPTIQTLCQQIKIRSFLKR